MSNRPSVNCELLPWDSKFFHCRIGRVVGDTIEAEQTLQIDQWSYDNRVDCIYFLARADHPGTLTTAARSGFELVDIRVTFALTLDASKPRTIPKAASIVDIRPVQPGDLPALQAMARTLHRDTRFFYDHHFPQSLAESLYSTWITLECEGRAQQVFVGTTSGNEPVGYISCHFDPTNGEGQIGLVGVSQAVQGRGLGSSLVAAALDWFADQGAKQIVVVTQGSNRTAQRLYQRNHFLTDKLQLWYHKWYSDTTVEGNPARIKAG